MRLTFLGTRGKIEARNDRHNLHSSLLVASRAKHIMVDAGEDWRGRLKEVNPDAIVLTHAHPDHAWGLKDGASCPVWAPEAAWRDIKDYPIADRHTLEHRKATTICGITFEAFPVEHSTVAPAVGYRITAGSVTIFYVPDVVSIEDREAALENVQLYVGDGATVTKSMVRKHGDNLVGHTPIRTQLTWCQKEGVDRAVFTHCGTQIVAGDEPSLADDVSALGHERGVSAEIAHDGMEFNLR